jgi:tetratricopeptide (TPR) repeat protein
MAAGPQTATLAIIHTKASNPPVFTLTRLPDGKELTPVSITSPYEFPVEGSPQFRLMGRLRWYLEKFLDYPFPPETDQAEHVLDALKAWGTQAFNAIFDRRDAGDWLKQANIIQIKSDDPVVLSWPWEALFDPQAGSYIVLQSRMERQLNQLPDPPPPGDLPTDRINILLVVARPYEKDIGYRSIARPLVDLIRTQNLPAHVDVLRPPTFDQLRAHLEDHPNYYHLLHFDGHGSYGDVSSPASNSNLSNDTAHQFRAREGCLVFENEQGEADPKSAADLTALLREYAVPAVVLNACQSGALDDKSADAFATVATALLQSGMRSVVAMAYNLYVSGAQSFLPGFYSRLFKTGSIAEGVRAGRRQMLSDKRRTSPRGPYELEDWLLPVLYQQQPIEFAFAKEAKLEARESHLPQEVLNHRDDYDFIGRDGPILEIERALHLKTPCILLQGLGGVGKTTLARGFLRWLDETGGLDAALWFDFRDIRSAEYVLNRIGQPFYGENFGVAPKKAELIAQALQQYRVIIVWDNFESAAQNLTQEDRSTLGQLLDAIRGTKGKVIITSRSVENWLAPPRRYKLTLGGLRGEERWEYCESVLNGLGLKVNRNDSQLITLMDQLMGHPLAMRVVLPLLERMPAERIVAALRTNIAALGLSSEGEQGRVFATLHFVEQGLPEELQPMMPIIGLHESYLDADYLEAMAKQVDPAWTRPLIDRLTAALGSAGLVRDIGNAIYELHPLLTSYLRSQAIASEACQRAFVDVMSAVADPLAPKELHDQRIPFFLHGANFHFALQLAENLNADDEYFAALTQSIAAFAQNSRDFVEASRLFHQLADHTAARKDWEGQASAYHQLGRVAEEQRDFDTSREWYLKALAIKEQQGDLPSAAITYHQLGMIAQDQRDFDTAREWYLKSLAIKEQQGNLHGAASTYHQLGKVAQEQRDFDTARKWYLKSLAISEKQGNRHGAAITYHQLGMVTQEQRDFDTAREWYLKSLAIKEQQGNLHGAANTYHQLGRVAQEQGDFDTAREWYLKSLAIKEQMGNLHGAAITYAQLGLLARKGEILEQSARWFARAIRGFREAKDDYTSERGIKDFLITYNQASLESRDEMKIIWQEADLGPFPTQADS